MLKIYSSCARSLRAGAACKGVVMVCDNGFYTQSTNTPEWHSCSQHPCGGCFGFTSQEPSAQSNGIIYAVSPPQPPPQPAMTLPE